jgi:hypothetical protein
METPDTGKNKSSESYDRSQEKHSFELWDKCFKEAESWNFYPSIERNENGEILAAQVDGKESGFVSRLPNEDFVKITRTPTFKAWFGDWMRDPVNASKVIYEDTGEPMVVYHGTRNNISLEEGLSEKYSKVNPHTLGQKVVQFSDSIYYRRYGQFQCFIKILTPLYDPNRVEVSKLREYIRNESHDGFLRSDRDMNIFGVYSKESIMHLPSDITNPR